MTLSKDGGPLNPTQQHYLKKELLNIEIITEFNKLSPTYNDTTGLRRFGPPFKCYDPKNAAINSEQLRYSMSSEQIEMYNEQFPILRFFLNQYVAGFPFIKMHLKKLGSTTEDQSFFWDKIQVLFEVWKSKRISNSNDRGELSRRQLALYKTKSLMLMLFNSAIRCTGDDIYFGTDSTERNAYKKLQKLIGDGKSKEVDNESDLESLNNFDESQYIDGLDINVAGVCKLDDTAVGLTKSHYIFLLRVRDEETDKEWYVKRRYSDFAQFHKQIRLTYAGNNIPYLPIKDKSRSSYTEEIDEEDETNSITSSVLSSAVSQESANTSTSISVMERSFLKTFGLQSSRTEVSESSSTKLAVTFPRENLRVSLRGYLRSLSGIEVVRQSPEFMKFLGESPELLTESELLDIRARERLDYLVNLQHLKFQRETIKVVKRIEKSMTDLKEEVVNSGMEYVFEQLRTHETIESLTPPFKALVQLIELEVASTEYELLIGSDSARDTFRSVKRMHTLFPYKMIATIMRFTNPLQVAKKMIDIFTYQMPHIFRKGRRQSLLQLFFTGMLNDDVKKAEKDIEQAREKFEEGTNANPEYTSVLRKIEEYFEVSDNMVLQIKKKAEYFGMDLLMSLLLEEGLKTPIPDRISAELIESYKLQKAKKSKHSSDTTLYRMAEIYFQFQIKKSDRSMLIELWEGTEMMAVTKEVFAIFFEPLIALFKKAELYRYIPIFAKYMSELIGLVEQYQRDYSKFNQTDIVASFMALEDKYAQYGYEFLHNLYLKDLATVDEDERVFDGIARWLDGFVKLLQFTKENGDHLGVSIDMNELLLSTVKKEEDRERIVFRVDEIIAGIEKKKQYYYEKMKAEGTENIQIGLDNDDNDYLKKHRNEKLTKNWDKINSRVIRLTNKLGESGDKPGENRGGGVYGVIGLNDADIQEMNLDLMEDEKYDATENPVSIRQSRRGSEFLLAYRKANSEGRLESDADYKNLQEWEDTKYREDLGKLADTFRKRIYEVLKQFQG
ncbi:hypothetical protein FOA43_001187 [Brettanomyces nanus]|uniref:PX domain-containing protein n=1 Tax=Eeniella nana TaxID=13502 RepID=A0A875S190_EENNA|nr:uncharacterized protein FOA43_001187 [Brettanomyces nanus]QPG73872.1 hypothetical protein FOA43_001187 [Brettanomyces nanus]